VREADAVLCISQSTANDLQRLLDVPPEKISVTHLGFSKAFLRPVIAAEIGSGARRPYLLYVGFRANYKNFARLLDAYAASSRLVRDFDLVAFGGPQFDDNERARIESLKLRPGAVLRQSGSDADLARAYGGAHALVYPSEYEGFGIPPLEAMGAGCLVICSNVGSIPEVVGDAGEYFDPLDPDSIQAAIERVVYDDERRAQLIERGHRRSVAFSWERCASETLDVYRRLL
jgi:glycosyltransferase involved in cell wall biosynthesis